MKLESVKRDAQGTRYIYVPLVATTVAFALSIAALVSCRFVMYYDEKAEEPELTARNAGIYCYEASFKEMAQNLFFGSIRLFVAWIATGTAILGGIATLILWKATKSPHSKLFKLLACLEICCVPGQFMTLSMLQSDFCWNYSKLDNNCSLGWGGNVSIASGVMYFVACVALCKVPKPIEKAPEAPIAEGGDEEAPVPGN